MNAFTNVVFLTLIILISILISILITVVCWGISYNIHRLNPREINKIVFLVIYLAQIVAFTLVNIYLPDIRRYAFFGTIVALIVVQFAVDHVIKPYIYYRYWLASLGCIAVGFGFWILDGKKILCYPTSWFQGHAVWHALDACSAFFLYVFFASEGYHPSNNGKSASSVYSMVNADEEEGNNSNTCVEQADAEEEEEEEKKEQQQTVQQTQQEMRDVVVVQQARAPPMHHVMQPHPQMIAAPAPYAAAYSHHHPVITIAAPPQSPQYVLPTAAYLHLAQQQQQQPTTIISSGLYPTMSNQ